MGKWQIGVVAAFFVIYVVVILITGEPVWLIPGVILALLALGWSLLNRRATEHLAEKHGGDLEAARSDEREPLPSAHLQALDDDRPMGDTPEAHDEINPHDLPPDHPGRQEAEAQAGGEEGTTRGDDELLRAAPERDEHGFERGG